MVLLIWKEKYAQVTCSMQFSFTLKRWHKKQYRVLRDAWQISTRHDEESVDFTLYNLGQ